MGDWIAMLVTVRVRLGRVNEQQLGSFIARTNIDIVAEDRVGFLLECLRLVEGGVRVRGLPLHLATRPHVGGGTEGAAEELSLECDPDGFCSVLPDGRIDISWTKLLLQEAVPEPIGDDTIVARL